MKKLLITGIATILVLLIISVSTAEKKNINAVTVVVPAESIAHFIKPLLPYKIDFGENFSGLIWVNSIEDIRIENNRIFFSTHIYGKDIKYVTKVQKRDISLILGGINLHNNWQASLRFDKSKKKLFIKPRIENSSNEKELSQGDILLNELFIALSDMEYPIDVNDLKPISAEFNNKVLTIDMSISDIYTENDKLFIDIIPTSRIVD